MPRRHSRRRHRHRHRSSFSSSRGGAPWLQPVQRRRRRRLPLGPVVAAVIVLAAAAGAFAFVRSRDDAADDPSRAAVQKFADAWAKGDLDAAWKLTTAATQQQQPLRLFRQSYTPVRARRDRHAREGGRGGGAARRQGRGARRAHHQAVRPPPRARSRSRSSGRATPRASRGRPTCGCPACGRARRSSAACARPTRANVLDAFGRRLSREPTAAALVGSRAGGRPAAAPAWRGSTTSGWAGSRAPSCATASGSIAKVAGRARAVGAHHDPPVRAGDGDRRARRAARRRRGRQPAHGRGARARRAGRLRPAAARLGRSRSSRSRRRSQHGVAKPSDSFPVQTAATLSGVKLRNASDEACGGSLTLSFAHSCNSVFAPLGAKLGRSGWSPPPRRSASTRSCRSRRLQAELDPAGARAARRPRGRRERDRPGPRPRDAAHDGDRSARRSPTAACA